MRSITIVIAMALGALLAATPASAAEKSWTDRITFKGNTRLRHERIDEEGEEERARMRIRARFGLSGEVNEDIKVVIQLATGVDNPVSANQTLDGGFSTKNIGLDLAYVDWKINDALNFYGGKIKNPLFRAGGVQLNWDNDLNPEGFALKYSRGNFFGAVGGFAVEERSSADDSLLYAVQAGMKFPLGDSAKLTAGVGYTAFTNTIGNEPFYNGSPAGNSVDLGGNYLYEYKNTEVFAELSTQVGDWPLKVYAHATQNSEAPTQDSGYAFGATLGAAKSDGDVQLTWLYMDVEADAVIGTFNDSNFGAGNTDADGHILRAKYAVSNKISLGGSLFINKIDRFQGVERDYNRLQLDVEFKFD